MARTMMNVRLQRKHRNRSVIVLHQGEYPTNSLVDIQKIYKLDESGREVEMVHVTITLPRLFNKPPQGQCG